MLFSVVENVVRWKYERTVRMSWNAHLSYYLRSVFRTLHSQTSTDEPRFLKQEQLLEIVYNSYVYGDTKYFPIGTVEVCGDAWEKNFVDGGAPVKLCGMQQYEAFVRVRTFYVYRKRI